MSRVIPTGLLVTLLIASFAPLSAQEEFSVLWRQSIVIPETINETLVDAVTSSDGPVVVLINAVNAFGAPVVHMARVEEDKTIRWIRQVLATGAQRPYGRLLAADSAGGAIAVVVDSARAWGPGCVAVRIDRYGQTEWSTWIPGLDPTQIVVDNTDRVGVWGSKSGTELFGQILDSGALANGASITGSQLLGSTVRAAARPSEDVAVLFSAGGAETSLSCALYGFDGEQDWHVSPGPPSPGHRFATAVARDAAGDIYTGQTVISGTDTLAELMRLRAADGSRGFLARLTTDQRPVRVDRLSVMSNRVLASGSTFAGGSFVQAISFAGDSLWRSAHADAKFASVGTVGDHAAIVAATMLNPDKQSRMGAIFYGSGGVRHVWMHDTLSFACAAGAIGTSVGWLAGDVVPGGGGQRKMPTLITFHVPNAGKLGARPELSYAEIDFGGVKPGQTARRVMPQVIRNMGDTSMRITKVELTGDDDVFTFSGITAGMSVAAFSVLGGTVSFTPDEIGEKTASVVFTIDSSATRTFVLRGHGGSWSMASVPNPLDFGQVHLTYRRDTMVAIVNIGTEPITVTDISIVGSFAFQIRKPVILPRTLAAGESIEDSLRFEASQVSVEQATLRIVASNVEGVLDVPLRGEGIPPAGVDDEAGAGSELSARPSVGAGSFEIALHSPRSSVARATIVNLMGTPVRRLEMRTVNGSARTTWNGSGDDGYLCPSGYYLVVVTDGARSYSRSLRILR